MNPHVLPSPYNLRATDAEDCYVIELNASPIATIRGAWVSRMFHLFQGRYGRLDCYKAMRHVSDGTPIPLTEELPLVMHGDELTWQDAQAQFKPPFIVQWGDTNKDDSHTNQFILHTHSAIIVHATPQEGDTIIFEVPGWNFHARLNSLLETHREISQENAYYKAHRHFSNGISQSH